MSADFEPSQGLAQAVQDHCKGVTASHKYPRQIKLLPELPKTTSARIRRETARTTG